MLILPLWLWGYVVLATGLFYGLQTFLPDTAAGLICLAIAIGAGVLHFLWREGAFERQPRPEVISATIRRELDVARLARDDNRCNALTLILASLRAAEMERQRPLSNDEELRVLLRERKRRVEAFQKFEAVGLKTLADKEDYEFNVLEEFMPSRLLPAARPERRIASRTAALSR